ncbi:hypothetical protein RhiirA1_456210 [Rhizophagus irregularis]|uniref:Uncharacterized protein n=1 Tax=Rhizophagus irregularis TaxID=588596 RepID=A0A2I1EKE8_9GLOM|nr:hypothetical protein RhiirA1_456210 [Rhizophagus irregularis]PKY22600.1 hypothetical protein RhiirB3_436604 [Rhizophagus irregularis]CAB4485125.1 unnamed protein product [Rhizophagus irregularis]CAB5379762.1 unnamed protein product [Rhizophagus irregularis]
MDFYKLNKVEDWMYAMVVYHVKLEEKDWMRVLDKIKKDLQIVTSLDSSFDVDAKATLKKFLTAERFVLVRYLKKAVTIQQQVLVTGYTVFIDNINNCHLTKKHFQNNEKKITDNITLLK